RCIRSHRYLARRLESAQTRVTLGERSVIRPHPLRRRREQMTSYIVQVVVEPDEDAWRAFIPDLESRGAATWGHTREEALRNIQEVAQMVIEELVEEQAPLHASVYVSSADLGVDSV